MTTVPEDPVAIVDRPDFSWPGGLRLAFCPILDLAAADPASERYGMCVGVWRLLDIFRSCELPVAVAAEPVVLRRYPRVAAVFRARGDEFVATGGIDEGAWKPGSPVGDRPAGWLARGHTDPAAVREAGYRYMAAACGDDQPVWLPAGGGGRIPCIPLSPGLDDSLQTADPGPGPQRFADRLIDAFDEQCRQSEGQSIVMCPVLRPHVSGQAHCLGHLRRALDHVTGQPGPVWLAHPCEVADAWTAAM